jgi:hypothetical protein
VLFRSCGGPVCLNIQVLAVKNCTTETLKMKKENFSETSAPIRRPYSLEDLNLGSVKFFVSLVDSVKSYENVICAFSYCQLWVIAALLCIQLLAAVGNSGVTARTMFRHIFTTALTISVYYI